MPKAYVKTRYIDKDGNHEVGEQVEVGASDLLTLSAYGILTTDKPVPPPSEDVAKK